MITKASIAELKREAKRLGVTVEVDEDCQCYRAYCPKGFFFEPVLHEYIAVFGGGIIGNGATKAEARLELLSALCNIDNIERCTESRCDWCDHEIDSTAFINASQLNSK